ncbi:MAG: hypothetical protein CSA70_09090 [Rhodobacterales bacterium]|nr:MAG: hypothetical protein CSA70_09090 [Rhodobacterales bacterium]
MTAGVVQFANLNLKASFQANLFAPFVIPCALVLLVWGRIPKIETRREEVLCLVSFLFLSILANLV